MARRDFLKTSAVAGASVVLGLPWDAAAEDRQPWSDRAMRWAQLVLVENDPGRFDPEFWPEEPYRWEDSVQSEAEIRIWVAEGTANNMRPWFVKFSGILVVTASRQRQSMTVHLVNLTNTMMMKGPFRELIPLSGQTVQIRIPPNAKLKRLHCLVAGKTLDYEMRDHRVSAFVPPILDHEVTALDLSS